MNRVKYTETFRLGQPVDVLFPLFSAEGEKLWVPGWDYRNIMDSYELHEDYVFITANHDYAEGDAIWLVKCYEPDNHYVQFYKVEPGDKVGIISVQCDAVTGSQTDVHVTYEYIALSEHGSKFVAEFTQEKYRAFIGEWQHLLENYFNGRT